MNAKTLLVFLALASGLALSSSCRSPAEEFELEFDGGDFDPDEDDAGPGEACPSGTMDLFNNAYNPYIGGEGEVYLEVVNYSYFRCPHCAHFAETSAEIWDRRDDFREHVRLYFHHYPFSNEDAWRLHGIAVAAGNQGMENFWAVHDFIYDGINNNDPAEYYTVDEVLAYVDEALYLDMVQFEEDRVSAETYSFLEWDKGQALDQSISGTPSVFVCGAKRNYSSIESIIDGFLDNI